MGSEGQECPALTHSTAHKNVCPQRSGSPGYNAGMIRIREILDPDLRRKVIEALAERRGMSPAAIPEWFELDDADFVDLLNDLKGEPDVEPVDDDRM